MSWRSLVIANKASLSIRKEQLIILTDTEYTIPLEDISVIVIENRFTSINTYVLSKFAEYKILLFICDEKHLPQGIFLPFLQHSRVTKIINAQLKLTKPIRNRIWQKLVKRKILNQSMVLSYTKLSNDEKLKQISTQVQSADKTMMESLAARIYFDTLFPEISRRDLNGINDALNYGYAILRGAIARALVSYGLLPTLGVGHLNELNNMNLCDDIIEVFRPVVDLYVCQNLTIEDLLSSKIRADLVNLLNVNMMFENQQVSVINAINLTVEGYQKICLTKDHNEMSLPFLLELELHDYER